ncbi:MAG TPA: hypothetical protein VM282_18505 [Acidimicrobiales bacterium]|nr:hypothetical protein [Acidimicrobiales bacterium]
MNARARSWVMVGLALLVGVAVGIGAVAVTGDGGSDAVDQSDLADPSGLPAEHRANAVRFLDAWERFRNGTFVVDLRFERTVTGKDLPLVSDGILVQQPPRRIVRAFGNESSVFADAAQSCELGTDATSLCAAARKTEPYVVQVAGELSILSDYFSGDSPLYRVDAPTANCFRLFLYRAMPLPPYGDAAQFCFDNATGAMTLFETTTASGSDRTTAERITTTVTEADFNRT